MEILFLTIGVSTIVAIVFLLAFIWATKAGQYDDGYSPSVRILFDDELTGQHDQSRLQISNQDHIQKRIQQESNEN